MLFVLNRHPQHQVGTSGDPGDNPDSPINYFDGLTRFYFDTIASGYGNSTWKFTGFEFSTVDNEPDSLVSSISAVYTGARYELNWAAVPNSTVTYEVRYSTASMKANGFTSGTSGGTVQNRGDDYVGVIWQSPLMAEVASVYFAIKPNGQSNFTEIYLPGVSQAANPISSGSSQPAAPTNLRIQ
jgi:hypothetical protein